MSKIYTNSRPEVHLSQATTLPQSYYTDPAWFQREMEAIHFDMWLCAGRVNQVPNSGDYFLREVANASVIILRDEQGEVRAFHNVCRHRGTLLCKEETGTFAGRIQCQYHAWTYKLDGTLANAPHMEKVQGFCEADYPLNGIAAAIWDGHIFINLSARPMPFAEHLAGLDEKFRPWRMEELQMMERRVYHLKANWKLVLQNYSECLHCPIVHPLLQKHSHYMSGDNEPPQPTYLGGRMELREGVQSLTMSGATTRCALPGLSNEGQRHVYYYCLLPNFFLNLHPDYMLTFTVWPRDANQTEIICEWHFHPDEIGKPGFDPSDAVEFWDITNRQDWELSDMAQIGISSKGYQPGPYSNREELLLALDRFVVGRVERRK
ncbi:MAG TPA: aromatic ring-hydroxylating dioxygenase subunit alpha [Candidatus Saccharimonadales bacterium]|jgi:Rieske 2Fe-2S family protein|nr:aromatic ring-hydroxylating dioxygenase subunit alpha [Candidatus Saccharimonadales bacterium]